MLIIHGLLLKLVGLPKIAGEVVRTTTDRYAINVYADYNQTFKEKHNVSVLLGVNQEQETYAGSTLYLTKMLDPYILNSLNWWKT